MPPWRALQALFADRQLAGQEALSRKLRESVRDLAAEGHLVERRWNLAPEERRRDQLAAPVQVGAGLLADPVERELDHQARVYDQHAQCDSRERRTAAATFGIGSPVSVSPHPAGSGAISGSSTGPVETTMRARAASASSRSRISRSSFSSAVTGTSVTPAQESYDDIEPRAAVTLATTAAPIVAQTPATS